MKNGMTIRGKGSRLSAGELSGQQAKDMRLWRIAMETKWQIGPVKLANGEDAFIDAINEGQQDWRYTGRVRNHAGEWIACGWHDNGRFMYAGKDHDCNLAPPPKKTVRVKYYLVVYLNGGLCKFADKAEAIAEAKKNGFALIEIDLEVTEGEGL
jgi:hypothetical protein